MVHPKDFYRTVVKQYTRNDKKPLDKIIGIDSEAYTDGRPFMLGTSLRDIILPGQWPDIFFSEKYRGANFVVWNIKYDGGAILRDIPSTVLRELWSTGKAEHNGYRYKYIPHKRLEIQKIGEKGPQSKVTFWDIQPFYNSSLDKAAKTYLKDQKRPQRTKKFRRKYVKRCWKSICEYCIHDAGLTQRLAIYLIEYLQKIGIPVTDLYSQASISASWVSRQTKVFTLHDWYRTNHRLVGYACEAYRGGKFEMTARGRAYTYEYDLTSAYPYELTRLKDISCADVHYSDTYLKEATYSFLRCRIENPDGLYIPSGVDENSTIIYPQGVFYSTITKEEYEYLTKIGVKVKVWDAAHLFVRRNRYPFKKPFEYLFAQKDKYKNNNRMLYSLVKIIMNGFYGKLVQCVEDEDDNIKVGSFWNPIYGAIITANTRIRVTEIQNLMRNKCLGVHTDSVITTEPIPDSYITPGLGGWAYETEGDSVLVSSGQYQIGDITKFRGAQLMFRRNPKTKKKEPDTWFNILNRFKYRKRIPYRQINAVESWVEVMAKNHTVDNINVFRDLPKIIDLNCDVKRLWETRANGHFLLNNLEQSNPRLIYEDRPPKLWENNLPLVLT